MKRPPQRLSSERIETDQSLRSERSKTDKELAAARTAIEEDADHVVGLARERAEALLRRARNRTDKDLAEQRTSASFLREVTRERLSEDRVVREERSAADEQLREERGARERALSRLLQHEREETDDNLFVERDRADEALATRDDFLGMVSHDLRTHLGSIALSAALLAKDASGQGDAGLASLGHAERIKRSTARMNRLIGDLLDVVSLEAGKLAVSPRLDDAKQLVRDVMEAFQLTFASKGITFAARVTPGILLSKFDHERTLQVLANLLSNALKFTGKGGHVTLAVAPVGPSVCFSVMNTGVGIPEDKLESIFERFRQVQAKDRRGLGLGLYIAKCIVEAHGGRIWAERLQEGGTALHFTLPSVVAEER